MKLGLGLGLAYGSGGGVAVPVGTTTSLTVEFVDASGGTLPHRVTCGAQEANLAIGDTEHTFSGLAYNTEYTVNVYAVDGEVESLALTVDVFTAPQFSPSGLAAEAQSESEIMLTWTDPVDPPASTGGGIEVWVSSNGIDFTLLDTVANAVEGYLHDGLTEATQRWYKVRAFNDNPSPHDDSYAAFTAVVNATTDADEVAPTVVSATVDGDQLVVTFDEPVGTGVDGEGGFAVDIDGGTQNIVATFDSLDGTDMIATFTLATPIVFGDVVTLQYDQPGDGWQDLATGANKLATFSGAAVTNATAAVFSPSSIDGLKLWLDATYEASMFTTEGGSTIVSADSDPVGRWEDRSGNGNHCTQSTAGAIPAYRTNIQATNPAIQFDGGDVLYAASKALPLKTSTTFIVAREVSQASDCGVFALTPSSGYDIDNVAAWVITTGSGSGRALLYSKNTTATIAGDNEFPWVILEVVMDGTNSRLRINGGTEEVGTNGVASSNATSSGYLIAGRYWNGAIMATNRLNGYFGEIINYDSALSSGDKTLVREYLATKWGITL